LEEKIYLKHLFLFDNMILKMEAFLK